MDDVIMLCDKIEQQKKKRSGPRLFTVAISGIDASGKGYITKLIQDRLEARGHNVANINIDPWQNPISIRLKKENAAENFYKNAFRWDDFFGKLVIPLQQNKRIDLQTRLIATHADHYYPFFYSYRDPDILMVEGIFLFQEKYFEHYDYKIWVDCSFETALKRAISRNIEKLPDAQLINDYETYYYPAQIMHFEKDNPADVADVVFDNN